MTKEEAQNYLHTNIPITKSMGLKVEELSREKVQLSAPLDNNRNHVGSVFGGSIDSLFFTTGWAFLKLLIEEFNPEPKIIGSKGEVEFYKPVKEEFYTNLIIPENSQIESFLECYKANLKAKITLTAVIEKQGITYASFQGTYVIIGEGRSDFRKPQGEP